MTAPIWKPLGTSGNQTWQPRRFFFYVVLGLARAVELGDLVPGYSRTTLKGHVGCKTTRPNYDGYSRICLL